MSKPIFVDGSEIRPIEDSSKRVKPIMVNPYSSSTDYKQSEHNVNLEEYEDYFPEGVTISNTLDKSRAVRQSAGEQFRRAVGTGIGKGGLVALENAGYLTDIEDWLNLDDEYGNALSNWALEQKEELGKAFPIYREDPTKVFDPNDFASWAEAIESTVESGIGYGITGGAVGGTVGKIAPKIIGALNGTAKGATLLSEFGSAAAMNYVESRTMAVELGKNIMLEAQKAGIPLEEAEKRKDEAVREFIWKNKATMMFDKIQMGGMFKQGYLTQSFKDQGIKAIAKEALKQGPTEFAEEAGAGFIQKEVERNALIDLDIKSKNNSTFTGRAIQYVTSPEGLHEGLMGLFTGPIQSMAMKGAGKLRDKITGDQLDPEKDLRAMDREKVKQQLYDIAVSTSKNAIKKAQALEKKDFATYEDIAASEFEDYALRHFQNGTEEKLTESLQEIISDENKKYDDFTKKQAEKFLNRIPKLSKSYETIYNKYGIETRKSKKLIEDLKKEGVLNPAQKIDLVGSIYTMAARRDHAQSIVKARNNQIASLTGELQQEFANLNEEELSSDKIELISLKQQLNALTKLDRELAKHIDEPSELLLNRRHVLENKLTQIKENLKILGESESLPKEVKNISAYDELIEKFKNKADAMLGEHVYSEAFNRLTDPKYLEKRGEKFLTNAKNEIDRVDNSEAIDAIVIKHEEFLLPEQIRQLNEIADAKIKKLEVELKDKEAKKKVDDQQKLEKEILKAQQEGVSINSDLLFTKKAINSISKAEEKVKLAEKLKNDIIEFNRTIPLPEGDVQEGQAYDAIKKQAAKLEYLDNVINENVDRAVYEYIKEQQRKANWAEIELQQNEEQIAEAREELAQFMFENYQKEQALEDIDRADFEERVRKLEAERTDAQYIKRQKELEEAFSSIVDIDFIPNGLKINNEEFYLPEKELVDIITRDEDGEIKNIKLLDKNGNKIIITDSKKVDAIAYVILLNEFKELEKNESINKPAIKKLINVVPKDPSKYKLHLQNTEVALRKVKTALKNVVRNYKSFGYSKEEAKNSEEYKTLISQRDELKSNKKKYINIIKTIENEEASKVEIAAIRRDIKSADAERVETAIIKAEEPISNEEIAELPIKADEKDEPVVTTPPKTVNVNKKDNVPEPTPVSEANESINESTRKDIKRAKKEANKIEDDVIEEKDVTKKVDKIKEEDDTKVEEESTDIKAKIADIEAINTPSQKSDKASIIIKAKHPFEENNEINLWVGYNKDGTIEIGYLEDNIIKGFSKPSGDALFLSQEKIKSIVNDNLDFKLQEALSQSAKGNDTLITNYITSELQKQKELNDLKDNIYNDEQQLLVLKKQNIELDRIQRVEKRLNDNKNKLAALEEQTESTEQVKTEQEEQPIKSIPMNGEQSEGVDVDETALDNVKKSYSTRLNNIAYAPGDTIQEWAEDLSTKLSDTTFELSVDPKDKWSPSLVGKFMKAKREGNIELKGWTEEEKASLPIKMIAYTDTGVKKKHNGKVIQGYYQDAKENTLNEYILERESIIKNLVAGNKVTSKVTGVINGRINVIPLKETLKQVKEGTNVNLYEVFKDHPDGLTVSIADSLGKLVLSAGIENKQYQSRSGYAPGYAYAGIPSIGESNGKQESTNIRLIPNKLSKEQATEVYEAIRAITSNNKKEKFSTPFKSKTGNITGLTNKQVIDLLTYQDMESIAEKHPFWINIKDGVIGNVKYKKGLYLSKEYSSEPIDFNDIVKRKDEIIELLQEMPTAVHGYYANNKFNDSGIKNNFAFFGKEYSPLDEYNDFIFSNNIVFANLELTDSGAIYKQPYIAHELNELENLEGAKNNNTSASKELESGEKNVEKVNESLETNSTDLEGKDDTIVKKIVEEGKEEAPKKPKRKRIRKGDGTSGKFSKISDRTQLDTIDVESASKWLGDNLPYVGRKVVKSLLNIPNGGQAEGQFSNAIITISERASKGTEYHEAWHAITQMYFNDAQRKVIYDEWRKENDSTLSDDKVEEKIAEEFRMYMLSNGEMKTKGWLKWIYDVILEFIDLFKDSKHRAFSRLRRGYFNYKPTNRTDRTLYNEITGLSTLNVKDAVDATVYMVAKEIGALDFDRNKIRQSTFQDGLDVAYNGFIDAAEENEGVNEDLVEIYDAILEEENWQKISKLAVNKLRALDIVESNKKDYTEEDQRRRNFEEYDVTGEQIYSKTSLEYNQKDNATGNAKLMLSFIEDTSATKSTSIGGKQLLSTAKVWNDVAETISDIVSKQDTYPLIIKALEMKASTNEYSYLNQVIKRLKNAEEYQRTQFVNAFSLVNVNYTHFVAYDNKGDISWKRINASTQGSEKQIEKEWLSQFKTKFLNEDNTVKKEELKRIKSIIDGVTETLTKGSKKASSRVSKEEVEILVKAFGPKGLGFNLKANDIETFFLDYTQRNNSIIRGMRQFKNFFLGYDENSISISSMLDPNFIWDNDSRNPLGTGEFGGMLVKSLSRNVAQNSNMAGDSMITGPDNKKFSTKSSPTTMDKMLQLWKNDIGEFNSYRNQIFHRHSIWMQRMAKNEEINNYHITTHNMTRVDGKEDKDVGSSASQLTNYDDILNRMNATLMGEFPILTFSDKPTMRYLKYSNNSSKGDPIAKFRSGITVNDNGDVNISDNVVNTFIQYFYGEYERIIDVLKSEKVDKNGKITYERQLSKGDLSSSFFKGLSYGSEVSNALGIYVRGSENKYELQTLPQLAKNKALVDYIKRAVISQIGTEIAYLKAEDILVTDRKGNYTIKGLSSEFLNFDDVANPYNNIWEVVMDYWYMGTVANIETMYMFGGDPAFYSDIAKRIASLGSDGQQLRSVEGVREHFNIAVVDDLAVSATKEFYEDNLAKLTKTFMNEGLSKSTATIKAKELLQLYKQDDKKNKDGINQADAQCYITLDRFKEIQIGLGNWKDEHEQAYKDLIDPNKEGDFNTILALQALKGTHFEVREDESNRGIPTFLKYSQAILHPRLVKGTQLENVYNQMITDGIDELIFASGVKLGATETSSFEKVLNGEAVEGHFKPIQLSNFNWKLQVDNPSGKYDKKGKTKMGSQPKKNFLANIVLDEKIYKYNGEDVDGNFIKNEILKTERAISNIGRDKLLAEYGITRNTDGTLNIPADYDAIFKSLLKEAEQEDASINLIYSLEHRIPFDNIFQLRDKIESKLLAAITKSTVKFDMPGGPMIQVSNAGMAPLKQISQEEITYDQLVTAGLIEFRDENNELC